MKRRRKKTINSVETLSFLFNETILLKKSRIKIFMARKVMLVI